jgi:hypothetical protein
VWARANARVMGIGDLTTPDDAAEQTCGNG